MCLENSKLETSIKAALQYFHIFRHPLYFEEIHTFLDTTISRKELNNKLNQMTGEGLIFCHENLYMLTNEPALVQKRLKGAKMASNLMNEAKLSAKIIAAFPFVKGVCISGSLSKGYADERSDIDFFIITAKRRLWICRSFLHLFKKMTFLLGKQHSFCMNYFIDESRLGLDEQNVFTGTELATLIPVYNIPVYQDLLKQNSRWIENVFPNYKPDIAGGYEIQSNSLIKTIPELILNLLFPTVMNKGLMKLTDTLWRRKWKRKDYPMQDYDLAMKTTWYVSKNHPLNYQKKVLKKIENEELGQYNLAFQGK